MIKVKAGKDVIIEVNDNRQILSLLMGKYYSSSNSLIRESINNQINLHAGVD